MFRISVMLFLLLDSNLCYECDFFNNLEVRIAPLESDTVRLQDIIVNGCFGPENIEDTYALVTVLQDNITYIGDHAIHDMPLLETVRFKFCNNIEEISAHAFENLPKLEVIEIANTKITSIPARTFKGLPSLEFLDLSKNNISEISREAFGVQPLLEYFILKRNNIKTIDHLWFRDCPNLHYVSFEDNEIEVISKDTFQFMPNLKQLILDFNQIRFIEEKSFHHFKELEILSLDHNKLVDLDPSIIGENFKVGRLEIRANFLNFLSENLLNKLSMNDLELSGNPWECACLDDIREWAVQENVTIKNYCRTENVPQCFNGTDPSVCSQETDSNNTELFLNELKQLEFPISSQCANLT